MKSVVINLNGNMEHRQMASLQRERVARSLTNQECQIIIKRRKRNRMKARLRKMPLHLRVLRAVILPVYALACLAERLVKAVDLNAVAEGVKWTLKMVCVVIVGVLLTAALAYLGILEHGYSYGGLFGNGRLAAACMQSALLIALVLLAKPVFQGVKETFVEMLDHDQCDVDEDDSYSK